MQADGSVCNCPRHRTGPRRTTRRGVPIRGRGFPIRGMLAAELRDDSEEQRSTETRWDWRRPPPTGRPSWPRPTAQGFQQEAAAARRTWRPYQGGPPW